MRKKYFLQGVSTLFLIAFLYLTQGCTKNPSPSPSPTTSDVNLTKGLLLYLPFDGNFADSSGNGNITTPVGGAALTYDEHGVANSSFGSTGNGERILVTNNGSISFDTAFTVSVDCMIRTNDVRQGFVSMVNETTGLGPTFILSASVPGLPNLDFGVPDSTSSCESYAPQDGKITDTTSFVPDTEAWYNIVSIFHKGTLTTYVNGKLVSTKTGGSSIASICPNAQVIIGGWWQADPISLNGKIDEVRLYNRVLNTDEINELAKNFQR